MATPRLASTWLTPARAGRVLVVGPSLGTSSAQLWGPVVGLLEPPVAVLAWDLPGHAGAPTHGPLTMADLAAGVLALVDAQVHPDAAFDYAGDSVGGAVGLQLLLDAPDRVASAVLLSTGARIGDPAAWRERAATVRAGGTSVVVDGSTQRWFSSTTRHNRPQLLQELAQTLVDVDAEGYAHVCEALADFDVRERLGRISAPVLAVAGAEDEPTPVAGLAQIADGVAGGRLVVLDDVAHLPPVEAPAAVAALLAEHLVLADNFHM